MSLRRKSAKYWKVCFMQVTKNDVSQYKTSLRMKILLYAGNQEWCFSVENQPKIENSALCTWPRTMCLSGQPAWEWKVCFMLVAKNDVSVENQPKIEMFAVYWVAKKDLSQ